MSQAPNASSSNTSLEEYIIPDETGNDLVDGYRLPVIFEPGLVKHRRIFSDRRRAVRKGIQIKRWKRIKELGRGGFGTVWLEQDDDSGEYRALKEVRRLVEKANSMDHARELLAMAALAKDAANFVQLEGWFHNKTHLYIAMEYFEHGDLEQCVVEPLPENEARAIIFQILEALVFMHERNFTHRDLKPSNVFVVSKSPQWWVKLADFGVSKRVYDDGTCLHTSMEGDFMAPEVVGLIEEEDGSEYTNAVDMWSIGCLAHWLLTTRIPIPRRKLFAFCHRNKPLDLEMLQSNKASEDAIDFISKLLKAMASDRLKAAEALEHPWPYDEAGEVLANSQHQETDGDQDKDAQAINPITDTASSQPPVMSQTSFLESIEQDISSKDASMAVALNQSSPLVTATSPIQVTKTVDTDYNTVKYGIAPVPATIKLRKGLVEDYWADDSQSPESAPSKLLPQEPMLAETATYPRPRLVSSRRYHEPLHCTIRDRMVGYPPTLDDAAYHELSNRRRSSSRGRGRDISPKAFDFSSDGISQEPNRISDAIRMRTVSTERRRSVSPDDLDRDHPLRVYNGDVDYTPYRGLRNSSRERSTQVSTRDRRRDSSFDSYTDLRRRRDTTSNRGRSISPESYAERYMSERSQQQSEYYPRPMSTQRAENPFQAVNRPIIGEDLRSSSAIQRSPIKKTSSVRRKDSFEFAKGRYKEVQKTEPEKSTASTAFRKIFGLGKPPKLATNEPTVIYPQPNQFSESLGKVAAEKAPGAIEANRLINAQTRDDFFNAIEVPPSPPNAPIMFEANKISNKSSGGSFLDAKALDHLNRLKGVDESNFVIPDDTRAQFNYNQRGG